MKSIFQHSIKTKQKNLIFYIDSSNNLTERIIRVIKMNEEQIVAYCYWRKKIRTFKIENILSAGAVKKRMGA
jgi:predicted DNA-binding transcriptional regulator YafY